MNIKAMAAVVGLGFGGTVLALAATNEKPDETPVVAETPAPKSEPVAEQIAAVEPAKKEEPAAQQEAKPAVEEEVTRGGWTKGQSTTSAKPPVSLQQLDALMAPVALYPDQLLSQILMASTYPLDVVEAARWRALPENQNLKGEQLTVALEDQDWDPSVKALVPFPEILKMMDSDLDWMSQVGDAFADQQAEVMDSVQRLRREARDADRLYSDNRRQVVVQNQQIMIEPANPDVVYVPLYNPTEAYGVWPYPDYPPAYIPPPVGYTYAPEVVYTYVNINPYWGWSKWDWNRRHIHIVDPPKWKHYHHGHDHVWRHDSNRDRRGRGPDRWRGHRPGQPGVNPNQPIVIKDGNFPHRRVPDGWYGNQNPRGVDAPPARPMRPQNPVYQRPPGTLPDMPPLPASAQLPALAPPITNPNIGIQQPAVEQVDTMRAVRPDNRQQWQQRREQQRFEQQQRLQQQDQEQQRQDALRRRQFQNNTSVNGPVLSNVPPQQQQGWRFNNIGGQPMPNTMPARPPVLPPPEPASMQMPQAAPSAAAPPLNAAQAANMRARQVQDQQVQQRQQRQMENMQQRLDNIGKPSAGGYCAGGARC